MSGALGGVGVGLEGRDVGDALAEARGHAVVAIGKGKEVAQSVRDTPVREGAVA